MKNVCVHGGNSMKRLVDTTKIDKATWLKYRKMGVTGTDAAAICGLNPYKSAMQVFVDKTTETIEEFDNEAMRQGRDMEAYIASRFCEETGKRVRRVNAICISEEHKFMLADYDRVIVGEKAGLEIKSVSPYSADKWADDKIPIHYNLQCQHYLAVSGFERWYVCALIWGRELVIRTIERDEELIQNLITIEKRFWEKNVLAGVMPEPDGSKQAGELLAKPLSLIFTSYDKELYKLTLNGFAIFAFSFLFAGVAIFGSSFFTALNNGLISALISFLRTLVFQIAAVMLLPIFFGINGIWISVVVAELMAFTVTLIFILAKRKHYHYG